LAFATLPAMTDRLFCVVLTPANAADNACDSPMALAVLAA